MKPGFYSEYGSSFLAKIDGIALLKANFHTEKEIVRNQIPFTPLDVSELNVYIYEEDIFDENFNVIYFPNPFTNKIMIQSKFELQYVQVYIYNVLGVELYSNNYSQVNTIEIET